MKLQHFYRLNASFITIGWSISMVKYRNGKLLKRKLLGMLRAYFIYAFKKKKTLIYNIVCFNKTLSMDGEACSMHMVWKNAFIRLVNLPCRLGRNEIELQLSSRLQYAHPHPIMHTHVFHWDLSILHLPWLAWPRVRSIGESSLGTKCGHWRVLTRIELYHR